MTYNPEHYNIKLLPPTLEPFARGSDPSRDIIVLMSGGVDSSATALLLKESGWNVVGVTMKIPVAEKCDVQRSCCGVEAAYVSKDLGIPHYYVDVKEAFERLVIEPFRQAYMSGKTPSPCVDCNTVFKFGLVWDYLEESLGVNNLATGHYARIVREENRSYLARASDKNRDQSYFLYGIPARRLNNFYLPLSEYSKDEVRAITRNSKLPVARRPDSMELCFAGEGDYRNVLSEVGHKKGLIVDIHGRVLGEHDGIANYTVGQRKGLGVAAGVPLYVAHISPEDNSVVVGSQEDVSRTGVQADAVNVLISEKLLPGERLFGKIRSQGNAFPCTVVDISERLIVEFDEPQFAPTPGQRLVLFDDGERVVAGGVII